MTKKVLNVVAEVVVALAMCWCCCLDLQDPYPLWMIPACYGPALLLMFLGGWYIKWYDDYKKAEEDMKLRRLERQYRRSYYRY